MTATLEIRLIPRASRNEVVGFVQGALKIKVVAPPIEGRANQELIGLLAQALKVRARDIQIIKGDQARRKVVRIEGLNREEILRRLAASP